MDYIFIVLVLLFVGINHYMSWKKIKVLKDNTKILEDYKTDFEESQDEIATMRIDKEVAVEELNKKIDLYKAEKDLDAKKVQSEKFLTQQATDTIDLYSIKLSKADEKIKSLTVQRDRRDKALDQITADYAEAKKYLDFYKQLKEYRICKDEKCYNIKHAQTAYCIDHLGDHIGEDNIIGGIDVDDKRT